MLFQKMLTGQSPYHAALFNHLRFEKHKHPEIEISYCLKGSYDIIINKKLYKMKEGDLAIIGSMIPHEYPQNQTEGNMALVMEAGPVMLSDYFEVLSKNGFSQPVIGIDKKKNNELYTLFMETADTLKNYSAFSELIIKGNVYKVFAYILTELVDENDDSNLSKNLRSISYVQNSLELIYNHYNEDLKIEDVANNCGYSKSNFCKIFKNMTEDTFHNVLNSYRVEMSCNLLNETDFSVEEIAQQVGFLDAKSFCRVFKSKKGISPGRYRIVQSDL